MQAATNPYWESVNRRLGQRNWLKLSKDDGDLHCSDQGIYLAGQCFVLPGLIPITSDPLPSQPPAHHPGQLNGV